MAMVVVAGAGLSSAQVETVRPDGVLDPSKAVKSVRTVASFHQPLAEEYIWTANDAAVEIGEKQLSQLKRDDWKMEPHDFRREFSVETKPAKATLYVAGPRRAKVWVNGEMAAEMQYLAGRHAGFGTMHADVSAVLRAGKNVIAIEAVRGYGSHHHTNAEKTSWLNSGEVLVAKLVGGDGKTLVMSDGAWKSAVAVKEGWEKIEFDDAAWKGVVSLGGIESSVDFFQWNADAGMYDWPGYLGESPYMANYWLEAVSAKKVAEGTVLDFGRELNGRLVVKGGQTTVRMGESMGELMKAPYLGEIALSAVAGEEARGPKTGFRYALVRGDAGVKVVAEGIYYPAAQVGSFESNDERVNRIFETAVYTAHLSMQDSILDGIKRDRGRWIGDDEVINRVAMDVYGATRLVKAGLEDGIGPKPVTEHVNGLPGYSAWWVVAEYEYFIRTGDMEQLKQVKQRMVELLELMAKELDSRSVYVGASGGKPFVDWSKGFSGDSAEARRAVHFEYVLAFKRAALMMSDLGDQAGSDRYKKLAEAMEIGASKYLEDTDGSFGDRWETNAIFTLAVLRWPHKVPDSGVMWPALKRTVTGRKPGDVITPYYGDYLLQAMAWFSVNDALQWMKNYWGGMLDNGATSFWEAWDPAWAGDDAHAKLEADDKVGYNASLSHGWSSGPAVFLLEEVLGVKTVSPGYLMVQITPRLAGLQWMKGAVATPLGAVKVEASERRVVVEIPAGMKGEVHLSSGAWQHDGKKLAGQVGTTQLDDGSLVVDMTDAGRYEFVRN
jgi:alpha-L-rhamnosidase